VLVPVLMLVLLCLLVLLIVAQEKTSASRRLALGGLSYPRRTLAYDWSENLLWPRIFFSADSPQCHACAAIIIPCHTIPYQTTPDLNSLPSLDLAGPR
jgi:hypothetical protein